MGFGWEGEGGGTSMGFPWEGEGGGTSNSPLPSQIPHRSLPHESLIPKMCVHVRTSRSKQKDRAEYPLSSPRRSLRARFSREKKKKDATVAEMAVRPEEYQ